MPKGMVLLDNCINPVSVASPCRAAETSHPTSAYDLGVVTAAGITDGAFRFNSPTCRRSAKQRAGLKSVVDHVANANGSNSSNCCARIGRSARVRPAIDPSPGTPPNTLLCAATCDGDRESWGRARVIAHRRARRFHECRYSARQVVLRVRRWLRPGLGCLREACA